MSYVSKIYPTKESQEYARKHLGFVRAEINKISKRSSRDLADEQFLDYCKNINNERIFKVASKSLSYLAEAISRKNGNSRISFLDVGCGLWE